MARVRFINNDGAGVADLVTVPEGQTVQQFLASKGITDLSKYTIRLNREECVLENDVLEDGARLSVIARPGTVNASERTLSEGDRVSLTPKKIAGATLAAIECLVKSVFND